jgi:hypothetical protein
MNGEDGGAVRDGQFHCPTYALVLADGTTTCERGDACPLRFLLDLDVQAFLDGHDHYIRLGVDR